MAIPCTGMKLEGIFQISNMYMIETDSLTLEQNPKSLSLDAKYSQSQKLRHAI
jgi:hypothetical protein